MLAAATLPAAMARMTVAGPETQSPPAKMPGIPDTSSLSREAMLPLRTATPSFSNSLDSMPCPTATIRRSQARRVGSVLAGRGVGRPPLMALIICC